MQVTIFNPENATELQQMEVAKLAFLLSIHDKVCVYCRKPLSQIGDQRGIITAGAGECACRECYVKFVGPVTE